MFSEQSTIVYLSYFDDSGSEPTSNLCVLGGIVVDARQYASLQTFGSMLVFSLGLDTEKFQEFKATELYFASGPFERVGQTRCRQAFLALVDQLVTRKIPFLYSAVKTRALLKDRLLGAAPPIDVAFRMCLDRLEGWARAQNPPSFTATVMGKPAPVIIAIDDLCVVITDDGDKAPKKQLSKTFRERRRRWSSGSDPNSLHHIHDSMYFGDSVDSIGLQMADIASWTMRRILLGEPVEDGIRERVLTAAICADPEPAWSENRDLFMSHADVSRPLGDDAS